MSDLINFIKSIPGAAKALTELVGDFGRLGSSITKIGTAKADQVRRSIENQTDRDAALLRSDVENNVVISKAMTAAVAKYIEVNSQAIGERALSHGIPRMIKEQNNREAVAIKTIENLQSDPPKEIPLETPTDDWLNLFGRYAQNASSEKLREHWAHILGGEIRKPGTFSFITLHLASILDEKLAAIIETVRPWELTDSNIPLLGYFGKGAGYSDLLTLDGIGFLSIGNHTLTYDFEEKIELTEGTIYVPYSGHLKIAIPTVVITIAGKELLSVLPPVRQAKDLAKTILDYLEGEGFKNATYIPKKSNKRP